MGQCSWGDKAERAMGQGGAGKLAEAKCAHTMRPQKPEASLHVLLPMQLTEREGRGAVHICAKQIWRKPTFPKVKCDTRDITVFTP